MTTIADKDGEEKAATALYQQLIEPLLPHIKHHRLIVVPHGPLHYLPIAALQNGHNDRYLLEDYTIRYAPSTSVLNRPQQHENLSEGQALVVGNPDGSLKNAEDEAKNVATLLGTAPVAGS